MIRLRRATKIRQLILPLSSQVVSSLTNFVASVLIARGSTIVDFGEFGLAFTVYAIFLGLSRAFFGEPLVVTLQKIKNQPGTSSEDARRDSQAWLKSCLKVLLTGSLVSVLILSTVLGVWAPSSINLRLLVAVLPILLLQDTLRYFFIGEGVPGYAVLTDCYWFFLTLIGAAFVLIAVDRGQGFWIFIVWLAAAALSSLFAVVHSRVWEDRPTEATHSWIKANGGFGSGLASEYVLGNGVGQVLILVMSGIVGLVATAGIRAAQVLLAPVNVILTGCTAGLIGPAVTRLHGSGAQALIAFCRRIAAIFSLIGLAVATFLLVLPDEIGVMFLGATWNIAKLPAVTLAIGMCFQGAAQGAMIGLRAAKIGYSGFMARLLVAPFLAIGGLLGAISYGLTGVVVAMATANVAMAVAYWYLFVRKITTSMQQRTVV